MPTEKTPSLAACASCAHQNDNRLCSNENGKAYKGCPTVHKKDVLEKANAVYKDPEMRNFAHQASAQEASAYANRGPVPYVLQPTKPRIQEICEFGHRMGYKRLGLAFCVGLAKEAAVVEEILKISGYEVVSACCKAGRTPKEVIDCAQDEKIRPNTDEACCNPVYQAMLMNDAETDFNILVGLCVGHDSLFFKYSEAPVTVLAAKDRVSGHNPLAAIYQADEYFSKVKHPELW